MLQAAAIAAAAAATGSWAVGGVQLQCPVDGLLPCIRRDLTTRLAILLTGTLQTDAP